MWVQQRGTEVLVPLLGDMVVDPLDPVGLSCQGFLVRVSKAAYQSILKLGNTDSEVSVIVDAVVRNLEHSRGWRCLYSLTSGASAGIIGKLTYSHIWGLLLALV